MTRKDSPTEAAFRATLVEFQEAFQKCLAGLLAVKMGELGRGANEEHFQNFQPRLYRALLGLSREHYRIGVARRALIARKASLVAEWFNQRQRTLAERQAVLTRAIRVGRMLGDAFIWFFYRNDQALLYQHLRLPAPSPPPAGIGGDGELALVDGVRKFGDKYILFHGISSLFRLGDASLFDFGKQRIVGIGELKTTRISQNQLELHFVASFQADVAADIGAKPRDTASTASKLTPEQARRLKRQLLQISKAAHNAEAPARRMEVSMPHMGHAGGLNELVRSVRTRRLACRQLGPGLLAIAFRLPTRDLASRLSSNEKSIPPEAMAELPHSVRDLVLTDSQHNCLILNTVVYSQDWEPMLVPGTTPFVWWPLESSVVRDMVLGNCVVVTVLNPAHLIAALTRRGFSVERFVPPADLALSFVSGKRKFAVEDASYFLRLVGVSMLSEDYVADLLESTTHLEMEDASQARVEMQFMHDMFGLPPTGKASAEGNGQAKGDNR
jgi:hypothetical protein